MDQSEIGLFGSEFLAKLARIELLSRRIFRGRFRADRRARAIGASMEFADYRNYAHGDDLRRIDWNLFGRLDRLFVKLHEEEENLDVFLLVDASRSMRCGAARSKFDHGRRVAAALGYVALCNLDRVDVIPFSDAPGERLGLNRGKGQFHKILEFLRRLPEMEGITRLKDAAEGFVARTRARGLVVLVSDFLDTEGAQEGISRLLGAGFEVEAIRVESPDEARPDSQLEYRGDCLLVDAETGEEIEVAIDARLLEDYRRAREVRNEALRTHCMRRGVSLLATSTNEPFEDLILRRFLESGLAR